jgi:hypothetical protein
MHVFVIIEHIYAMNSVDARAEIQAVYRDMPNATAHVAKQFGQPVEWVIDGENEKHTDESEALGERHYTTIHRHEVLNGDLFAAVAKQGYPDAMCELIECLLDNFPEHIEGTDNPIQTAIKALKFCAIRKDDEK